MKLVEFDRGWKVVPGSLVRYDHCRHRGGLEMWANIFTQDGDPNPIDVVSKKEETMLIVSFHPDPNCWGWANVLVVRCKTGTFGYIWLHETDIAHLIEVSRPDSA